MTVAALVLCFAPPLIHAGWLLLEWALNALAEGLLALPAALDYEWRHPR